MGENDRKLTRMFEIDATTGDGRTVDMRIVPYGVPEEVSDEGGPMYREQWEPGCFDNQVRAADKVKVLLNFEHEQGINGVVGRGLTLTSEVDGLHGSFRIFDGEKGDITLELVREGVLGGVSLEAYPKKSIRTSEGIVKRVFAHLDKVALCRRPAFKDAVVLAVREQNIILDEEFLPIVIDPAFVTRLAGQGVILPAGLQAHPAITGTPA